MYRELAYQASKLRAPIELKGRTVRKGEHSPQSSLGRWESFGGKDTRSSQRDVARRWEDYGNAKRTVNPDLNNSEAQPKTRKIAPKEESPNPGNMLNLFKKTGTIEEVHSTKKKFFKEKPQEESTAPKRSIKPNLKRLDDMQSHISTLGSPTYASREEESMYEFSCSPRSTSKTRQMRQDFLKSSISILPCGIDTKKSFQDRDEAKIIQSACAPRVARHLETTYGDQPLSASFKKKDPNRKSSEDYYLVHSYGKGKKPVAAPCSEYFSQAPSTTLPPSQNSHSYRSGSMEPLNPMYVGRRAVTPQKYASNITNPPKEKDTPRGQTMFSYRTYASQLTF